MATQSNAKKAALFFKQALAKEAAGDEAGVEKWLEKAAAAEKLAVADGETVDLSHI